MPKKIPQPPDAQAPATEPPPPGASFLSADEQRAFFFQARWREANIPKFFREKTLDNYKNQKGIVQMAREYVKTFGAEDERGVRRGLILYGSTGSGKTHVLVGVLRELIATGRRALYYNVPDLFKEIRATYNDKSERGESELLDEIAEAEILALDDLGAEKTSDWVLDRLYWIVNRRYEAGRPILVTTNHDWPGDLEKVVQRRIISRLAEMCKVIGPFPSEDWRMKQAGMKSRMG